MIFVVSAPSGAGKTSLIKALIAATPGFDVSISHTTRPQRPGEIDGEHYYFVSGDKYKQMAEAGEFVETATVFEYSYATSKAEIARLTDAGKDILLDIDWQGAKSFVELYPDDCVSIYILPPSNAELQKRLEERGQDDATTIAKRMDKAHSELMHYPEYQYIIVNDDFEKALADLQAIVRSARLQLQQQQEKYAELLKQLTQS